jgi:O-succinylbenzoic acid--CoA ligase
MPSSVGGVQLGSTDLVAAALPAGPTLVRLLRDCWHAGAALLPVDPRLPPPALDDLMRRARPTVTVDGDVARRVDGDPVPPGAAAVVATSGTSGRPRLVLLSRDAITAAVRGSAERLGIAAGDPWLLCVPPAHIGGLLVLFRGLLLDVPVVVHGAFDVDRFAAETGVRCVSVVPTMLRRLVDARVDMRRLRTMLVGGDSLNSGLAERARALGAPLVHTYGQSQSCGGVVYDGVPLRDVTAAVSAAGEVLLGGPTLMSGYRGDDAATASAFTADGRLRTGDQGVVDGGVLRVLGRLRDVIVSGGEKVAPADVEDVLRAHPGVRDAAVVGEADDEWGERVVAMVVPAAGSAPPLADLRDWVRARLPAYAAPKDVLAVDDIPRTPSGKVRREAVRAQLATLRSDAQPG